MIVLCMIKVNIVSVEIIFDLAKSGCTLGQYFIIVQMFSKASVIFLSSFVGFRQFLYCLG